MLNTKCYQIITKEFLSSQKISDKLYLKKYKGEISYGNKYS